VVGYPACEIAIEGRNGFSRADLNEILSARKSRSIVSIIKSGHIGLHRDAIRGGDIRLAGTKKLCWQQSLPASKGRAELNGSGHPSHLTASRITASVRSISSVLL
jgi:hypothetical protein